MLSGLRQTRATLSVCPTHKLDPSFDWTVVRWASMKRMAAIAIASVSTLALVFAVLIWRPWKSEPSLVDQIRSLGFTPVMPPSTLAAPGSLVMIESRDPLRLGIICPDYSSLGGGIADLLVTSQSLSIVAESALTGKFTLSARDVHVEASSQSEAVRSVRVTLENVRILELADDTVFGFIAARSPACAEALAFRTEDGVEVSMVKSVLVADATFKVHFSGATSLESQARTLERLEAAVGGRLSRTETSTVVGKGLFWALKDDTALAKIVRSSEGATGAGLGERGSLLEPSERVEFIDLVPLVRVDIEAVRQPDPMSCWAAAGAMLANWNRTGSPLTAESYARSLGHPWTQRFEDRKGIDGREHQEFARSAGLVIHPPQNFMITAYAEMLQSFGPLWIATTHGNIGAHARVLVGVYGDGSPNGTLMEFIDPRDGSRRREPFMTFLESFEQEARDASSLEEIRWQVMHRP